MFYHAKLKYLDENHYWWNNSREQIVDKLLIPFINGQVVPITKGQHRSLLNMKNAALLRIYKTDQTLLSKKSGTAPAEILSDDFDAYECTDELVDEMRELQASSESTSLLQKAFAIPQKQVFVVMKFGDKYLDSAYQGVIKPVIEEFGYKSLRIDEIQDSGDITEQVLQAIASSKYVLADLTGERPNCYYETGFAHALGKEMIFLIRKGEQIHFDLAGYRFIQWETEYELRKLLMERFINLEKGIIN